MAGYSATPLWKKLGYKEDASAYVEGAPENYLRDLELPAGFAVRRVRRAGAGIGFVHLFVSSRARLGAKLETLRGKIATDGIVWVSWPKKSSGVATDITEDVIRELALPLGFVDIKVCAVDAIWSGLKLVIRKALR